MNLAKEPWTAVILVAKMWYVYHNHVNDWKGGHTYIQVLNYNTVLSTTCSYNKYVYTILYSLIEQSGKPLKMYRRAVKYSNRAILKIYVECVQLQEQCCTNWSIIQAQIGEVKLKAFGQNLTGLILWQWPQHTDRDNDIIHVVVRASQGSTPVSDSQSVRNNDGKSVVDLGIMLKGGLHWLYSSKTQGSGDILAKSATWWGSLLWDLNLIAFTGLSWHNVQNGLQWASCTTELW